MAQPIGAPIIADARLHVVAGGTHDFVQERAAEIAPLFQPHVVTLRPDPRLTASGGVGLTPPQ